MELQESHSGRTTDQKVGGSNPSERATTNRISALIPNILPDPTGGDQTYGFDVNVILHYAGNGRWSYEEDVYNPKDAEQTIGAWVAAGGTIPG